MTTLRSMIATFLNDLTRAQDQANELSVKLSRKYRKRPILRYFPVPNALLDEADLTLQFSIDAVEPDEPDPPATKPADGSNPPPRIVATEIAANVATLVLADLRGRIAVDDPSDGRAVVLRRQLWTRAVQRELTRNLASTLHSSLIRMGLAPAGPEQHDADVRAALADALEATFHEDQDLAAFAGPAREWSREQAKGDIGGHAVRALLDAVATGGLDEAAAEPPASAYIKLEPPSGEGAQGRMQTVRLRARLRNYKWVIIEEGDHDLYDLVPES